MNTVIENNNKRVINGKMQFILQAWRLIWKFRTAYLAINGLYYSAVILAMIFVAFHPDIQQKLLEKIRFASHHGLLGSAAGVYTGGTVMVTIIWTFMVNLIVGSFLFLTLPSLIVPFSGLVIGMLRAIFWGLLISPVDPKIAISMIPHSLTLVLEGQAYIITMLAVYVQGKAFLWPKAMEVDNHYQGYISGLKQTASLYSLVAGILALSAIYEALEVIYVVPWLLKTHG
jgi:hypothetical protein